MDRIAANIWNAINNMNLSAAAAILIGCAKSRSAAVRQLGETMIAELRGYDDFQGNNIGQVLDAEVTQALQAA